MEARYLFRGKTIDGVRPHFVIGHYVSVPRPMIVSDKAKIGGGWDFDDVDPATIGQCTGITAAKSYRGEKPEDLLVFYGDTLGCDDEIYGYVHYDAEYARYYLLDEYGDEIGTCAGNPENWTIYEIFGNIYDNPELMEAQP